MLLNVRVTAGVVVGAMAMLAQSCPASGDASVQRADRSTAARPRSALAVTNGPHADVATPGTVAEISVPAAPARDALRGRTTDSPLPRDATFDATKAHARAVAPVSLPYSAVGYFEADGVRMAVLALGSTVLLKKRGDEVGDDFRLVVVDPPALLHLPSGAVLRVRPEADATPPRVAAATPARLLAPDPVNASEQPADPGADGEIAAEIARALAAPAPPPVIRSSFPLAR